MHMSTASIVSETVFWQRTDLFWFPQVFKASIAVVFVGCMIAAVQAQTAYQPAPGDNPYIVDGVSEDIVFALGHSLRINGTVKAPNGAIALGGDVVVQGIVEGDVAAFGGSVIQLEGSRINGDVMVVGGTYPHADKEPLRGPAGQT